MYRPTYVDNKSNIFSEYLKQVQQKSLFRTKIKISDVVITHLIFLRLKTSYTTKICMGLF